MTPNQFFSHLNKLSNSPVMPVMFVGHGSPMNALPDNPYYQSWSELGTALGKPQAILCISAHWTTSNQSLVASTPHPETIYDFYGFPQALYDQNYPAVGAPELALDISTQLANTPFHTELDNQYGLDHGTWCIIKPMFPEADVPVFQLSLPMKRDASYHYEMGKALRFLRRKGVLIVASGNIVHNLRTLRFDGSGHDWADEFDAFCNDKILARDDAPLVNYREAGRAAELSINSAEHYIPLLYTLGLREEKDQILQFNEDMMSSLSMRSVIYSQ